MKLRHKESMPALGIFLGAVALIAALVLALVSKLTEEPIRQARENNRQEVFQRLRLGDFDHAGDGEKVGDFVFYPVSRNGVCTGYVGQGQTSGYGGEIEVLVGFSTDGKITGVQILRHKETPGLGAEVCERKFQRTIFNLNEKAPEVPENAILDQFDGRNAADSGNWRITRDGGDCIYLTGATVSSRAVVSLVDDISAAFSKKIAEEGK